MADAIVRENSLHYNGNNYFRVNSSVMGIGAVGEKRSPITKGNFLEVKDRIHAGKLKVRTIGEVLIDSQRTNKRDFLANISVAKVFKIGKVENAFEEVLNRHLRLIFLSTDGNDMVDAINRSPAIREDLFRWGKDARIVTSGFVIMDAESSRQVTSSTDIEAEVTVHGVTIKPKLSVSTHDKTDMVYPVGSFFGYGLSRIECDSQKKPTRVVDLKFDPHGL